MMQKLSSDMVTVLLLVELNGKRRLSHLFTEAQRRKLVLFFFERMVRVLDGFTIYAATPDDLSENGYCVIRDEWGDINKVITKARERVQADLLILPCDLPFVECRDIDELLRGKSIVIVPSQDGGTNALILPRDVRFETQFGKNSFRKHLDLLKSKNLAHSIYESDNFRDIDTEEDVAWALEHRKDSEFVKFLKEELENYFI